MSNHIIEALTDYFMDCPLLEGGVFRVDSLGTDREFYTMDRLQNIANSGFYEDLADWVEEQSRIGNLPVLPDGMTADSMEVMSPGYIFDMTGKTARYQMPMRLVYIKEVPN